MEWYKSWFNTSYYHILYQNHSQKEANDFMFNLVSYLKLKPNASIIDLACGKGRHSIYLNTLNYDVLGLDLSENSINYANEFQSDKLKFKVHNMLNPYPGNKVDAVFNLFTSYGYFESDQEDITVFKNIQKYLKKNGVFVMDYLNADYVLKNIVEKENKIVQDIDFKIHRYVENGFIKKNIKFIDQNVNYDFTEQVKAITIDKFKTYINLTDFKIKAVFGDYNLTPFDKEKSKRCILVLEL